VTVVSLKQKILDAKDLATEQVEIAEWGVVLDVRTLTVRERAEVLRQNFTMEGGAAANTDDFYASLVIQTVLDPDTGDKVFEEQDREHLKNKSAGAMEKIAKVAIKLAGLGENAVEQAGKDSSSATIPTTSQSAAGTSS
jgi:hypothetical protein